MEQISGYETPIYIYLGFLFIVLLGFLLCFLLVFWLQDGFSRSGGDEEEEGNVVCIPKCLVSTLMRDGGTLLVSLMELFMFLGKISSPFVLSFFA